MIIGAGLMGCWAPGIIGFPLFMRGIWLQRQAARAGLSMRPMIVTLIGYLVMIDGMLNTSGLGPGLARQPHADQPCADSRLGLSFRRRLLLALQRALARRRRRARREILCLRLYLTVFAMRVPPQSDSFR